MNRRYSASAVLTAAVAAGLLATTAVPAHSTGTDNAAQPSSSSSAAGSENGYALDRPSQHGPGTYKVTVTNLEPRVRTVLDRDDINLLALSSLVSRDGVPMGACDEGDRCWEWPDEVDDDLWYPQGLTGSRESMWSGYQGTEVVVSAWYRRATEADHTSTASQLRFVTPNTDTPSYRTVTLMHATGSGALSPLEIHAGGAAWAGPYLYVADTDRLFRFDVRQLMQDSGGNPLLVPDRRYDALNDASTPLGEAVFSSISTDWSGSRRSLVSAQYTDDHDVAPNVVRWPLRAGGALASSDGVVGSTDNLLIDTDSDVYKVQGVEAHGDTYYFSQSDGYLDRRRAMSNGSKGRMDWGQSGFGPWRGSDVPQDLYGVVDYGMFGQTEEDGDQRLFFHEWEALFTD
ncbi:hypothetical protein ACOCJ7_14160 [Knoellia sp. CPCC 206453]|uniref:hypothetical protein n=1 Tax=Knoellia pratensis TaxID=3404796 RepID=UPI003609B0F4